jgi:hypothetical protein
MAVLKMKLAGKTYAIDPDKLTLGEALVLKRDFGMTDFTAFNYFDPEQMVGLFVIAVKRAHPEMSDDEVRGKVEGLQNGPIFTEINKQIAEAVKKASDPQKAGAAKAAPASGTPAKTRKTRGVQS